MYQVIDGDIVLAYFHFLVDAQNYVKRCEPKATIHPLDSFATLYMKQRAEES